MANPRAGRTKTSSSRHCIHPSLTASPAPSSTAARTVTLPLASGSQARPQQQIRPSRSGKRRAIVLAAVQILIAAHIILWLLSRRFGWFSGGQTITPVEPSESMEFTKYGLVNAGLIFFTFALLSTLVLGRWFCGWGCHIVMLQDLCGWFMKRCGVRPKPFRSRLLIYVPLLLALYMFIWPLAYRWGVLPMQEWLATKVDWISAPGQVAPWGFHVELTTRDFWKTFAGVAVAIPFLLVCGFATVYFLGAKGFCTYGCPYGGFFAPLDKLAIGKIRVTDACEGCGHCTAVCTSNVRVHEEVREYGMVVDPGCMKCLDCVSVCPNEALYFGFGPPTIAKGAAKNKTPVRKYDMTLGEEFVFAGVFALTFFSTRGVYGAVPMLMAAGMAGCVTFLAWKTWRILRDDNAAFHHFQLKLKGSMKPAGLVFAGATALALLLTLHSGAVKAAGYIAGKEDDRVTVSPDDAFSGRAVDNEMQARARSGLAWYERASFLGSGGIGLLPANQAAIDVRRAWLHCVLHEFDEAETILRDAHTRHQSESTSAALAMLLRNRHDQAKSSEALKLYEEILPQHPDYTYMLAEYEQWALPQGRLEQVLSVHRGRLERDPFNRVSLRASTILLLQNNRLDEGLAAAGRWCDARPNDAEAHRWNAIGMAMAGREGPAIASARLAVKYAPHGDYTNHELLAQLLDAAGQMQEAAAIRAQAKP